MRLLNNISFRKIVRVVTESLNVYFSIIFGLVNALNTIFKIYNSQAVIVKVVTEILNVYFSIRFGFVNALNTIFKIYKSQAVIVEGF